MRLTNQRERVLYHALKHPGSSVADVARARGFTYKAAHAVCARLVELGYLEHGAPAPGAAPQATGLYLTEQGRALCSVAGLG